MTAARPRPPDRPLDAALDAVRSALRAVSDAAADLVRAPDGPAEPLLAALAGREQAWSAVGRLVAGPLVMEDRLQMLPEPDPTPVPEEATSEDQPPEAGAPGSGRAPRVVARDHTGIAERPTAPPGELRGSAAVPVVTAEDDLRDSAPVPVVTAGSPRIPEAPPSGDRRGSTLLPVVAAGSPRTPVDPTAGDRPNSDLPVVRPGSPRIPVVPPVVERWSSAPDPVVPTEDRRISAPIPVVPAEGLHGSAPVPAVPAGSPRIPVVTAEGLQGSAAHHPVPAAAEPSSPPPAQPRAAPPSPLASQESLTALAAWFSSGAHLAAPPREPELLPLASAWGPPEPLQRDAARACVPRIQHAASSLHLWLPLSTPLRQRLLAYAAARLRQVQEALGHAPTDPGSPLGPSFAALTRWSAAHRPGKVRGLARADQPERGSWLEDARAAWEALGLEARVEQVAADHGRPSVQDLDRALVEGVQDVVLRDLVERLLADPRIDPDQLVPRLTPHVGGLTGRALKPLRNRIRAARAQEGAVERTLGPDPDWPWAPLCVGRRAALLGGDRGVSLDRLKEAFGFLDLRWETGRDPRRVESLAERIESGTVELVLVARRWLNHSANNRVIPACRRARVPFVMLDSGFSVERVRRAIEERLRPAEEAAAAPGAPRISGTS